MVSERGTRRAAPPESFIKKQMTTWFKQPTLVMCAFAPAAVKNTGIQVFKEPSPALPEALSRYVLECESRQVHAIGVFPWVRGVNDLLDMADALRESGRWSFDAIYDEESNVRAIDLGWVRESGEICSCVGFMPSDAMPASRRAPYCAIGLWPGPRSNALRTREDEHIGIGDASHSLSNESYRELRKRSESMRKALKAEAIDHAADGKRSFWL